MQSSDIYGVQRSPRSVLFGPGQRAALPTIARSLGKRALIVTDERLRTSRELTELLAGLSESGVAAHVFSDVEPELPVHCIHDAASAGSGFGADLVIAIGGGSCLDAAKLAALLITHGGSLSDYYGEFKVPGPTLPVVAVPTTSGTGSEVTPVAVVADSERIVKVGISSPFLIPEVAVCDPELTMTCPPGLTALSGADALAHAVEAFTAAPRDWTSHTAYEHVFVGKNFLSDRHALAAIGLICNNLARACRSGDDVEARVAVMQGALSAAMAFGTAGTSLAHAIQYPVGALTHTAHGTGVAILLPFAMAFNRDHILPQLTAMADVIAPHLSGQSDIARADAVIDLVASLFTEIGIPGTLAEIGVSESDLPQIAELALGTTRLIKNNPRELTPSSMLELVSAAYTGDRASLIDSQGALAR
jgi:alcohol dehydrogenase class IV